MTRKAVGASRAFENVVLQTAAFGTTGGCVLYAGAKQPVSNEDWSAYLEFLAPRLSKERVLPRVVWDDSGGPSPLGRQKLAELTQGCPLKVALIGDAAATRNVTTVLNWNREAESYRAFTTRDIQAAIAFVGISGPAVQSVTEALYELRSALGFQSAGR